MARLSILFSALALIPACGGDDGGGEEAAETLPSTSVSTTEGSTSTTMGGSGTTSPTTTATVTTAMTEETGPADSTGPGNACDPVIPGEWNACVDANGGIDNTLCNWMGTGGAVGFIGCLNSGDMDGANVCFISDCVDACDCFAPPADGTAVVTCGPILEGGGNGCFLDCSAGQTCPAGMQCLGQACFHPPA